MKSRGAVVPFRCLLRVVAVKVVAALAVVLPAAVKAVVVPETRVAAEVVAVVLAAIAVVLAEADNLGSVAGGGRFVGRHFFLCIIHLPDTSSYD